MPEEIKRESNWMPSWDEIVAMVRKWLGGNAQKSPNAGVINVSERRQLDQLDKPMTEGKVPPAKGPVFLEDAYKKRYGEFY